MGVKQIIKTQDSEYRVRVTVITDKDNVATGDYDPRWPDSYINDVITKVTEDALHKD